MKSLTVPLIKELDSIELSEVAAVMELKARRESIDVLNWATDYPYKPVVVFDIARGANELYLHYFVHGLSIKAVADDDGEYVHPDSCVEFFMRKQGEMKYINFEFNCIGTCLAARHESREVSELLTREEFKSIRRYPSLQREAFAEKKGIYSWELTVAIPFKIMGLDGANLPAKIYGNFYKCADETANPHYVTWSPIDLPRPNYHCPEFFGEIYF
ncbi:MAG: hypothetical protein LBR50_08630 [Tannerella sp.]|jgi:hypothetical protein|nr:hypothetical protein [Tannerella sp.]